MATLTADKPGGAAQPWPGAAETRHERRKAWINHSLGKDGVTIGPAKKHLCVGSGAWHTANGSVTVSRAFHRFPVVFQDFGYGFPLRDKL